MSTEPASKFATANEVRNYLKQGMTSGRFNVRGQPAIVGELAGKTLNDVQLIFIVDLQAGDRDVASRLLHGTNAYLKVENDQNKTTAP
jgi:hypothetical protein